MSVKITSEKDLLDVAIRKALIDEFNGAPNQRRKAEAFKAYECLKDKTINYVYELLTKQFEPDTVAEMQYAMTNVSILRKVIDKLAKVYANGVKRTMPEKDPAPEMPDEAPETELPDMPMEGTGDSAPGAMDGAIKIKPKTDQAMPCCEDPDTQAVEDAAKYLGMNKAMKKTNRYFRTFKNCLPYVRPKQREDGSFDIGIEVLPPHHYDVVESPLNPQEALAVIISDYTPTRKPLYAIGDAALAGRTGYRESHVVDAPIQQTPNTGIVQTAQSGGDADKRQYIWWTKNFHFTTNAKGEIISQGKLINPIARLPFVNFAGDQDNCFWADGGSDLVDAGIKINVDITNVKHVGFSQGYGQMYMTGRNLPKSVKVGPTHCVQMEYDKDQDPAPSIGYLSSNPPLAELMKSVEMQVALMLTTNNLSESNFSLNLSGSKQLASGVALLIDKSESVEDVGEQAEVFIEKEPKVWEIARDWFKVYGSKGLLSDDAKVIKIPENVGEVMLSFPPSAPVVSEMDELNAIKMRKELNLNTEVELIMRDNPGMSEDDAQEKLEKIKAEKQANASAFGLPAPAAPGAPGAMDGMNGNQSQESGGLGGQNNNDAGSVPGGQATGSSQGTG